MEEISKRRFKTSDRIRLLQDKLSITHAALAGKACVYATGSFGRREAGVQSDLDLFIVGKSRRDGIEGSLLKDLDAICLKADLIQATRELGIPDFDGDGRYLTHYKSDDFTKTLGTAEDDVTNTFTARLLLLLESYPLLEDDVFGEVTGDVIAKYWRDYEDHKSNFIPAFLANDILRLWRTFCVNYEARTEREPDSKKIKGKVKNYKLKHSRMLTCYSALIFLLTVFRRDSTVSPQIAMSMVRMSPTERLEWLLQEGVVSDAHESVRKLLDQYNIFLLSTIDENELSERLSHRTEGREYAKSAYLFGDTMFEAMNVIGGGERFHRLLVI